MLKIIGFERARKKPYYRLTVRFTCDHCGKDIEPGQNGMLCWKDGEFRILHGGSCILYYDYLWKSVPLKYVSIQLLRAEST